MIWKDDLNREVEISEMPKRIVSLCPSITETICKLDLQHHLVGITDYCIHPEPLLVNKERIGGTKSINIDKIHLLEPDLILAVKEENLRKDIRSLQKEYPVFVFDIKSFDQGVDLIDRLGDMLDAKYDAHMLSETLRQISSSLIPVKKPKKALYLIWKDPIMAAGKDTFISSMMNIAGFKNCLLKRDGSYPKIDDLNELDYDTLILSTEPYEFSEHHIDEFRKLVPDKEVILVDGEMFSWYGSHMVEAVCYIESLRKSLDLK
ncbi:MAG: ABC transporter substrate-binding protein [Hyphomicrobiales bacterium]